MKRVIAIVLCFVLVLSGCSSASSTDASTPGATISQEETSTEEEATQATSEVKDETDTDGSIESHEAMKIKETVPSFKGMDDPELLNFVEYNVYSNLVKNLDSDQYFVENVKAVYISQEYLDELAYNSQSNLYFGYTLEELDQQFQGDRYVFTLGENGETTVIKMETVYDDSTERVIKNVAVGGGVILLCVTVSVVSAGVGAPAVSMIFAAAAKTGTSFALSSAVIGGAAATITTGYQTHDPEAAFKAGLLAGSEGFKWGAISGAVVGGASEGTALYGAAKQTNFTMNQYAKIQQESGYPLDVIKQFKSIEEYNVYKEAGLKASQVGGKSALIRNIDLNYKTTFPNGETMTNLEAMAKEYAPRYIDPSSGRELAYQLHHVNQNPNGTLAILTEAEHQGNSAILNILGKESEIDRQAFNAIRKKFWMDFAAMVG